MVAILLAGTILYYNSQISKPKNQTSANLVTTLDIREIPRNYPGNVPSPLPHAYLYITGSVNNTAEGTAFNAGLHAVAYDANGGLEINLTVPLINGETFGTDAGTDAYVSSNYGSSSFELTSLPGEQNATVEVGIFHEGTVTYELASYTSVDKFALMVKFMGILVQCEL